MGNVRERIVLTAWARKLKLEWLDGKAAFAFLDEFRGCGPKTPLGDSSVTGVSPSRIANAFMVKNDGRW